MTFRCRFCSYESTYRWRRSCPKCALPSNAIAKKHPVDPAKQSATSFATVDVKPVPRISTGIEAFDRVLGGGLVAGSTVLLFGPPKTGKTTLLVQTARGVCEHGKVLYASGEQKRDDVAPYVARCNATHPNFEFVGAEHDGGDIYKIVERSEQLKAKLLIADSANVAFCDDVKASEGSTHQLVAITNHLTAFGKRTDTAVIMICHIKKDGDIAGPEAMKHLVDTVVEFYPTYDPDFEPDEDDDEYDAALRELWSSENRWAAGPGVAKATFRLTATGMQPVEKRSKLDPKAPPPKPKPRPRLTSV